MFPTWYRAIETVRDSIMNSIDVLTLHKFIYAMRQSMVRHTSMLNFKNLTVA